MRSNWKLKQMVKKIQLQGEAHEPRHRKSNGGRACGNIFQLIYYKSPLEIIFLALKVSSVAYALDLKEIRLQTNFQIMSSSCYIYNIFELECYLLSDVVHTVRGRERDWTWNRIQNV